MQQARKLPAALKRHPVVQWAINAATAYATGNYARFLRLYLEADLLSATILSAKADLARQRILWLLVRLSMRGDKIPLDVLQRRLAFWDLETTEDFLLFHGLEITGSKVVLLPACNKGQWDVRHSITPACHSLGHCTMPEHCDFKRRPDGNLQAKCAALGQTRTDITLGAADPMISGGAVVVPAARVVSRPVMAEAVSPSASVRTEKASPFAPLPLGSPVKRLQFPLGSPVKRCNTGVIVIDID